MNASLGEREREIDRLGIHGTRGENFARFLHTCAPPDDRRVTLLVRGLSNNLFRRVVERYYFWIRDVAGISLEPREFY